MSKLPQLEITDEQLTVFLEQLFEQYHIDFRQYGKAHLKRRLRHRITLAKYDDLDDLSKDVLNNKAAYDGLFSDLSINVTELFRDPQFYAGLRLILDQRKTEKPIRVWVSACATGEEAFSIMMMLEHFHISYEKIYATDFNSQVVERASQGIMETSYIKDYLKNMTATEFGLDFSQFFEFKRNYYQLKPDYLEKMEFQTHNLMNPPQMSDFDIVLCRNVLIYFEKELQNKVVDHLTKSLNQDGLLCLGNKESLRFMNAYQYYTTLSQTHKIYQKK